MKAASSPLVLAGALTCALLAGPALAADAFRLSSPDVAEGKTLAAAQVLNGFGCTGGNVSPALSWTGAPADTKSFAVTVYDPDAPTGSGWWHWIVFNLPASVTSLPAGAGDLAKRILPAGAVPGRTDFGGSDFGGACPPAGDKPHRYIFSVHALKVDNLPLDGQASGAMVGFFVNANTIAKATVTAVYGR
jgi:Raf kinase inhibitor-like YbhB/YbcL family protein